MSVVRGDELNLGVRNGAGIISWSEKLTDTCRLEDDSERRMLTRRRDEG